MALRGQAAAAGRPRAQCPAWRSLRSADFAAALTAPVLAKSPHFVLHHIAAGTASAVRPTRKPYAPELSTGAVPIAPSSVDNNPLPSIWWLGLVVPKRHARRAVSRSVIKRQMRVQADAHRHRLPPGLWLIRLRAPFDRQLFPSAASAALRQAARSELEQIFARAATAMPA